MKLQLVAGIAVLLIVIGGILAIVFFGPGWFYHQPSPALSNVLVHENFRQGTTSWQIPAGKGSYTEIQAYASASSVYPRGKITFYVSTQRNRTHYLIEIYRLGWYEGLGGRLMASYPDLVGKAQGYYDPVTHRLVDCNSCFIDTKTGLIEANWQPSYTLTVPSYWLSGAYLAKFTDVNERQTYVPFDVRSHARSYYLVVTSDNTYQAYNEWGGYSLYMSYYPGLTKAVKVSFDRPYYTALGSGNLLRFDADTIRWLERSGYDVTYMSDVDLHEDPAELLNHHAYLSLGHDEYWSKEMRDGVEHARNEGIGLAFLGANAAYWQIRYEPDSAGVPDRTIVCYKVQTELHDLARDPLYGVDNSRVTTLWRDPVLNRPENALIGIMWSGYTVKPLGFPWRLGPQASSHLLDGTDLQAGQAYGCELAGYEWDRVFDNGATPAGLTVLATSPTRDYRGRPDVSNTAYYIAPSGALVFASGSIYWTAALDAYRYGVDRACLHQDPVVPGIQKLLSNVMANLIVRHPSQQLFSGSAPLADQVTMKIAMLADMDIRSVRKGLT